jgi:hypothetical protein
MYADEGSHPIHPNLYAEGGNSNTQEDDDLQERLLYSRENNA